MGRPRIGITFYTFTVFKKKSAKHNFTISMVKEAHLIEKSKVSVFSVERERRIAPSDPVLVLSIFRFQHVKIPSIFSWMAQALRSAQS
jgi:hypothetical protein